MARKQSYKRKRSPILLLVCEGRNKTERKYFSHYKVREVPYRLEIRDSEATDVTSFSNIVDTIERDLPENLPT